MLICCWSACGDLLYVAVHSVVVPLLIITVIFSNMCAGIFKRPFEVMSLRNAVDLDKHDQVSPTPHVSLSQAQHCQVYKR